MEQQFNLEFKKTKQSDSGGGPATPAQVSATTLTPVDNAAFASRIATKEEELKAGDLQASGHNDKEFDATTAAFGPDQKIGRPGSGTQTASNSSPDMNVENRSPDGAATRDVIPFAAPIQEPASSASNQKRRKKRTKTAFQPLPVVDCVIFRGATGKMKQRLALTQSFATLFKMMSQNYGNRELAFKLGVVEEISVIAVVCQDMPRVLDYYIWIVDVLYRDGFGDYLTPEDMEVRYLQHCAP